MTDLLKELAEKTANNMRKIAAALQDSTPVAAPERKLKMQVQYVNLTHFADRAVELSRKLLPPSCEESTDATELRFLLEALRSDIEERYGPARQPMQNIDANNPDAVTCFTPCGDVLAAAPLAPEPPQPPRPGYEWVGKHRICTDGCDLQHSRDCAWNTGFAPSPARQQEAPAPEGGGK
jgi:hypothetical protein